MAPGTNEDTHLPAAPAPALDEAALHGLAGDVVRTIDPHTEAAPVAVLVHLLTAFGNAVGRSPHFEVEATKHRLNLFTALVGTTSAGRKGTSWAHAKRLFKLVDQEWAETNVATGLATGPGLLWDLRDPVSEYDPKTEESRVVDPGVPDKRRLYVETELGRLLSHSAQVSAVVRQAWDEDRLSNKVRQRPTTVTDPHVSIVGHITPIELNQVLRRADIHNGLANRFLWFCVTASKSLPFGGDLEDEALLPLAGRLKSALKAASGTLRLEFDAGARAKWPAIYRSLEREGSDGYQAMLARSRPQVRRLACIYALLDTSREVTEAHLDAAVALERYAADSVQAILRPEAPLRLEEKVRLALQGRATGLSITTLHDALGRNFPAAEIRRCLGTLQAAGWAKSAWQPTKGRPSEIWTWCGEGGTADEGSCSEPPTTTEATSRGGSPMAKAVTEEDHLRAGKAAWSAGLGDQAVR